MKNMKEENKNNRRNRIIALIAIIIALLLLLRGCSGNEETQFTKFFKQSDKFMEVKREKDKTIEVANLIVRIVDSSKEKSKVQVKKEFEQSGKLIANEVKNQSVLMSTNTSFDLKKFEANNKKLLEKYDFEIAKAQTEMIVKTIVELDDLKEDRTKLNSSSLNSIQELLTLYYAKLLSYELKFNGKDNQLIYKVVFIFLKNLPVVSI